jgi:hypothetical protein
LLQASPSEILTCQTLGAAWAPGLNSDYFNI